MLAALNIGAVLMGTAAGSLAASLLGLMLSGVLNLVGVEQGPDIGLVVGILTGLATGGWIAGTKAKHSFRFHGALTGLALAFLILVIARLGGSPASTPAVLWLAALSALIAGFAGWLAGRRKRPRT